MRHGVCSRSWVWAAGTISEGPRPEQASGALLSWPTSLSARLGGGSTTLPLHHALPSQGHARASEQYSSFASCFSGPALRNGAGWPARAPVLVSSPVGTGCSVNIGSSVLEPDSMHVSVCRLVLKTGWAAWNGYQYDDSLGH